VSWLKKHNLTPFTQSSPPKLHYIQPPVVHLRDGEVVLYHRPSSPIWQCRFKLFDGKWYRTSTKTSSIEIAIQTACLLYDEARFRQKLGLAHVAQTFAQIAQATLEELRKELEVGRGKSVYHVYITCIEKYFVPYFGEKQLEAITHKDITDFELWRNRIMERAPKASTMQNFASAWNRLCNTAISNGWISDKAPLPKLTVQGQKSNPRPGFTREEIDRLLAYMPEWTEKGRFEVEREIRPLLRDYVEMLLYTGMRHGTEAMGIQWNHIEWHTDKENRYIRIWVDGKTGGRWLIAKHKAVDVLKRLQNRQPDIKGMPFDELLKSRVQKRLFRFGNDYQPPSLNGTFRRLMRDSGLLKDIAGQTRTLYSLRHTYATLELLENGTDIHTLAKQMGNSAAMIEKHYSKLTATMAAKRLA
jgi:integrase